MARKGNNMKKTAIAIGLLLASNVAAKSFTMEDYSNDPKGGEIKKVETKKHLSIAERTNEAELRLSKLESEKDKFDSMVERTRQSFAERGERLALMKGDTSKATKSLALSRKAKETSFKREDAKLRKAIAKCKERIAFLEKVAAISKIGRGLKLRVMVESRACV